MGFSTILSKLPEALNLELPSNLSVEINTVT